MLLNPAAENVDVKIYPNPTKNMLNVEYGDCKNLTLINMLGEKVYEVNDTDNNLFHTIDTEHISEGFYLLKIIKLNDEVISYKIKITH